jgi:Tfp pilus assembly protein PilO
MGSDPETMKPLNRWTSAEVIAFVKSVDKKVWVIVLSGAVIFLLMVVLLIVPAWIERPMLRRDIESMEAQIRQVNILNQKRLIWEKDQKVFSSLIDGTRARVFTAEDMGLLLGQVSKMAVESGVDVLASRPSNEKTVFSAPYNLKYQSNGYEFTVQGGYHDLGKLTSRIETHHKLLRIRSLEIVPAEKTPNRHVIELRLWAILETPQATAPAAGVANAKK